MGGKIAACKKHHLIYRTTCVVTGKYYIGMHSTDDREDCYLGSGKILGRSVKKHGRRAHIREILEELPDRESLRLREAEIVTEFLIRDPLCMNVTEGGKVGGTGTLDKKLGPMPNERRLKISRANKGRRFSKEHKLKLSQTRKGRVPWNKGKRVPDDIRRQISETLMGHIPWNKGLKGLRAWNKGVSPSDETRKRLSESHKGLRLSKQTRELLSVLLKGRVLSQETRRKMSESRKGIVFSDSHKRAISLGKSGKVWCHDPVSKKSALVSPNAIPEGYVKGRK